MTLARIGTIGCILLAGGCKATTTPPPSQPGAWHLEGSSHALFSTSDGGDFGDADQLEASVQGGRFVSDKVLVEGSVSASRDDSDLEDLTTIDVGVGGRYYFVSEGAQRPYVALLGGIRSVDIEVDGGADDSDTVPAAQVRGGLETFISEAVSLDFGIAFQQTFGLEIEGVEDDITTFAGYVGIAVWL